MKRSALTFTIRPGSAAEVATLLSGYGHPVVTVDAETRLVRTSVFLGGNRIVRMIDLVGDLPTALRHLAAQPEVRAVEEALNGHLEQPRDLTDAANARAFFARAMLPEVGDRDGAPPHGKRRVAVLLPVACGRGPAVAKSLAALRTADWPAAAVGSTVLCRDDVVVWVFEIDAEPDDTLPALVAAISGPEIAGLAGDLDTELDLGNVAGLSALFARHRMTLLTDRHAETADSSAFRNSGIRTGAAPGTDRPSVFSQSVAICGLGTMGGGLAGRLLDCGIDVKVWNRSSERAAALGAQGATVLESAAAAARSAAVTVLSLADEAALDAVLFGSGGVLADGPYDGLLICASTVAPTTVTALAAKTSAVLDVGLLGNGRHARDGQLRMYVGGDRERLAQVRPLLEMMSKQLIHAGPLGSGMRLKLLMNLLMGVEVQALAEATALGVSGGLDRDLVLDAIRESGFASPVMGFKARRLAENRFDQPDFRLRLMSKDLRLAVQQAAGAGLRLPVTEAACSTHSAGVDLGHGDADCAAVMMAIVKSNGKAH